MKMTTLLASLCMIALLAGATACKKNDEVPAGYGGGQPIQSPQQALEKLTFLRDAVKTDPKNAAAWTNLGNALMDGSQFADAVEAYTKALDLDPKNVDVRVDRGTCYRGLGKFDKAVEDYRKGVEINPKHVNAYRNLAVVQAIDLKNTAAAAKTLDDFLTKVPTGPEADGIRQMKSELAAMSASKMPSK